MTDKSKLEDEQKKRVAAVQKDLLEKLPSNHPLRDDARKRGVTFMAISQRPVSATAFDDPATAAAWRFEISNLKSEII